MVDPSRPRLTESPCSSHNFMLWTRWDEENYEVRLQCLRRILQRPFASYKDQYASVLRIVFEWEDSDFYLPLGEKHRDIFQAAHLVASSPVSSGLRNIEAFAQAVESIAGGRAASSSPPVDVQQRISHWEDGTSAHRHLAIMRDHGWGSSRGTKRTRRSFDDEA